MELYHLLALALEQACFENKVMLTKTNSSGTRLELEHSQGDIRSRKSWDAALQLLPPENLSDVPPNAGSLLGHKLHRTGS
jgi:hypothetical protein